MKIRHVSVRNFRGIVSCDWSISERLLCLVGPGDGTKTSMLDAIGLALSRNYTIPITDADFPQCDTTNPIVLEVTVAELPKALITQDAFGLKKSGIWPDGKRETEPVPGTEECLVVRLSISETLEPIWEVIRIGEEIDSGKRISASQRQQLGYFRLGENVDTHLRWSRASALSAMTEKSANARSVVLSAHRSAREASFDAVSIELQEVADIVHSRSHALGSGHMGPLRPGLDPMGLSTTHALVLHDSKIPLTAFGEGTRRLASLSIQEQAATEGSIIAIDEIEHGLEPHRLAHLLRYLRSRAESGQGQVVFTTHSPIAVTSLAADQLRVVRSENGVTRIITVTDEVADVQGTLRAAPYALLGRKVIVGEGATEVGFLRALSQYWDSLVISLDSPTSIVYGLVISNGGGQSAATRARVYASLGYETALLVDNDEPGIDSAVDSAVEQGVYLLRWSKGRSLEDEIVTGATEEILKALVGVAIGLVGEPQVLDSIKAWLPGNEPLAGPDPKNWISKSRDKPAIVRAISNAAQGKRQNGEKKTEKAWFKNETGGETLGTFVVSHLDTFEDDSSLLAILNQLRAFIYQDRDQGEAEDEAMNAM